VKMKGTKLIEAMKVLI